MKHLLNTDSFDSTVVVEQLRRYTKKQAYFLCIDGVELGRMIPLTQGKALVVGRDPRGEIVLQDDGISRRHAEAVLVESDRVLVRDLQSTNGIYVGGERVTEAVLNEGEKILLGRRTILKFVLQDELDEMYQRQMYSSSVKDGLTGIYNRKYFDAQLAAQVSFARRHHLPLSLIIFDLDHFKRINDAHGHLTGDLVLVAVTEAVGRMIRREDIFARYGGEEFAVIALGIDGVGGQAFAERLRRKVSEVAVRRIDDTTGQAWLKVTISVGVATIPVGVVVEPAALIERADENLYEAKRAGRDRVCASVLS